MFYGNLGIGESLPQSVLQFRIMPNMNCVGPSLTTLSRREFVQILG